VTYLLVHQFEDRVPEDKCPYLLVVLSCPDDYTVKGTVLVSNYYYDFSPILKFAPTGVEPRTNQS